MPLLLAGGLVLHVGAVLLFFFFAKQSAGWARPADVPVSSGLAVSSVKVWCLVLFTAGLGSLAWYALYDADYILLGGEILLSVAVLVHSRVSGAFRKVGGRA